MVDGGQIIDRWSLTTALKPPTYGAATKGSVEPLSHSLAKELGPWGITVNAVRPGPTVMELLG
jgi:3-oxoacyl-[acyl-carrier protein] reductase